MSLNVLLAEVNKAAPKRSKASDGSIGDAAHASRTSDHNPWIRHGGVGIVRARDFTNDPNAGCDSSDLAEEIRLLGKKGGHPALKKGAYVIADGRISSATYGFGYWKKYTGTNGHFKHCHVSVTTESPEFDSLHTWGVLQDKDSRLARKVHARTVRGMFTHPTRSYTNAQKREVKRIQKRLNALYKDGLTVDGIPGPRTRRAYLRHERRLGYTAADGLPGRPGLKRLFKGTTVRVR